MKRCLILLPLLIVGCAGSVPDQSIIPTNRVEVPAELRVPCKANKLPERRLDEADVLEYLASVFDEIDGCDTKRGIAVDMLDNLNTNPSQH